MKKIWISIFLIISCVYLYSQENDFQLWSSLSLSDRVTYKTDVTVKLGSRFRENASFVYKTYHDVKLRYKYDRNLSLACGYRSVKEWDDYTNIENISRYYSDLYLRKKLKRYTFYLRNRFQNQSSKGEYYFIFRQKWSLKYNIRKNKIDPIFAFEYFLNENYILNKIRYTLGVSFPLLNDLEMDLVYRLQQQYNVYNPENIFIISTGISYEF